MIGIIYDNKNKKLMENELSSLKFQGLEKINLFHGKNKIVYDYHLMITDNSIFPFSFKNIKFILIIHNVNQIIKVSKNIVMVQYESIYIKNEIEKKYPLLKKIKSVVINRIPRQKLEIKPLEIQDATIFYHGKDEDCYMIDEMFYLDMKTYYYIKFYRDNTKECPSKKHRLSWNVSTNKNEIGIIPYKILKEIENGCLPILLKENAPSYFKSYPFFVTKMDLDHKELLIKRVKDISHFISKMTREEFASLSNSIYNGIYINSKWNYNFFLISEEINIHRKKNRV